jgi:hypothetical protein
LNQTDNNEYARKRLNEFCLKYKIFKWPVDCIALAEKIEKMQTIPLKVEIRELPLSVDAFTMKIDGEYTITINSRVGNYPFQISKDRRRNFTYAHELFHIELGHCEIPEYIKTPELKKREDDEVNNFASLLLLPEELLLTCNFVSIPVVARAFLVSEHALLHRLTDLKRHDIRYNKKALVCSQCGNDKLSKCDCFCSECGAEVRRNKKGVFRDNMLTHCTGEIFIMSSYDNIEYINLIGNYIPTQNSCTSVKCHNYMHDADSFCTICGNKTSNNNHGLFCSKDYKIELQYNQLLFENKIVEINDDVISAAGWTDFLSVLKVEFKYLFDKSSAIIIDEKLIICSHKFTYVNYTPYQKFTIIKKVQDYARSLNLSLVEVADFQSFFRTKNCLPLSKWIKSRQKIVRKSKFIDNNFEDNLTDIGMSKYDFLPQESTNNIFNIF